MLREIRNGHSLTLRERSFPGLGKFAARPRCVRISLTFVPNSDEVIRQFGIDARCANARLFQHQSHRGSLYGIRQALVGHRNGCHQKRVADGRAGRQQLRLDALDVIVGNERVPYSDQMFMHVLSEARSPLEVLLGIGAVSTSRRRLRERPTISHDAGTKE